MAYEGDESEEPDHSEVPRGIAAADRIMDGRRMEALEEESARQEKVSKYATFLNKRGSLTDTEAMRAALMEYFPGRFGDRGQQPIRFYPDNKVFGTYQAILRTAREAVAQG